MIKSELVARLARAHPHLYQRDLERVVARVFSEIADALARGERVELRGFGAFSVKERGARVGRNPRTGETVQVDAKHVPFFKTGKELRERLNLNGNGADDGGDTPRSALNGASHVRDGVRGAGTETLARLDHS